MAMEEGSHNSDTPLDFENSIAEVAKASTKERAVTSARMPIDAEFHNFHAVWLRAKCRRTKHREVT